ncbi:hypothetical protein MKZ38_004230 [Zalerion maritima]|uniref:Uncharacterized protein n=1 Tax=Zalerion maritima TaxID=339359 RepID=A0AAD5WPP4_9PEZI|nr:hypothetical protein MKZ38_004230 [Zalerion maritima]
MATQAPSRDVYLWDANYKQVNQKILKTNGEFILFGKHLAWGVWISPTRYTAYIPPWGGWWVGVMNVSSSSTSTEGDATGMNTAVVKEFSQTYTVAPSHKETFRPKHCFVLQSGDNQKVLTPDGKFFVLGNLHGTGSWVSPTRFAVETPTWGGWWVGVVVNQGMKTMIVKNKADIETAKPGFMEFMVRSMET